MNQAEIKSQAAELEWLGVRKKGVGSSDAPVLSLGKVWKKYPVDIYIDKKTPAKLDTEDNPNFRRGHTYEPLAIGLFQEQQGIKVFSPHNDFERYGEYQKFHPDLPVLADFDGICEDYWVYEGKAPSQRNFDIIIAEGVPDHTQVQASHLAGIANVSEHLPGVGGAFKGKIKGTRIVFYSPDRVELFIYEQPLDQKQIDSCFTICDRFWRENILAGVPPLDGPGYAEMVLPKKAGDYTQVKGRGWEKAVGNLMYAKDLLKGAERRVGKEKQVLIDVLAKKGLSKVVLGSGVKVAHTERAGSTYVDMKALQADHLSIDLKKYNKRGKPSRPFNIYGANKSPYADDFGGDSGSLVEQIDEFLVQNMDPENRDVIFSEIEQRAQLFLSQLTGETDEISKALLRARKVIGRGDLE